MRKEKSGHQTKRDFAYNCILKKITSECLSQGTPLREDHLAEEFGISATPIREAFRRLELEGWVQCQPNCGAMIRSFSPEEIKELFNMRELYEGSAASLAAVNATEDELGLIRQSVDKLSELIIANRHLSDDEQISFMPNFDLEFHEMIFQAAHSPLLYERYKASQGQIQLLIMQGGGGDEPLSIKELQRISEEHQMIYLAIRHHWSDAAELLLRRHIANACAVTLERMATVKKKQRKK